MRGYQFKSEGPGEAKKNPVTFTPLNERAEKQSEAAAARRKKRENAVMRPETEEDPDETWFINESLL
jgi:hypothetical protein